MLVRRRDWSCRSETGWCCSKWAWSGAEKAQTGLLWVLHDPEQMSSHTADFALLFLFSLSRKNAEWHKNKYKICLNASISEMSWDGPDLGNSNICYCGRPPTWIPSRTSKSLHISTHYIWEDRVYKALLWILFSAWWLVWSCCWPCLLDTSTSLFSQSRGLCFWCWCHRLQVWPGG